MNAGVSASDDAHPSGDPATPPIARFSGRLAALFLIKLLSEGLSRQKTAAKPLLLLAGPGPQRALATECALPAGHQTAHSGAFNCRFQVCAGKDRQEVEGASPLR